MKPFVRSLVILTLVTFCHRAAAQRLAWVKQMAASGAGASGGTVKFIGTDSGGNVITAGSFSGTLDFDPGPGVHNLTAAGSSDIYISKLDASGQFLWARRFGKLKYNEATAAYIDPQGNLIVTGHFYDVVDFDPGPGVVNLASYGDADIFVLKLDPAGNYKYAYHFGGGTNKGDYGQGITGDPEGNVYISGVYSDAVDWDPGPGTVPMTGTDDAFILKLDSSGSFRWVKSITSSGVNEGLHMTFKNGYLYYSGVSNFQSIVQQRDTAGNVLWQTTATGAGGVCRPYDLDVDASGNVIIVGSLYGAVDFDPGPGAYVLTSNTGSDLDFFVWKLDRQGRYLWAGEGGSSEPDLPSDVTVDDQGFFYVTGSFYLGMDVDFGPGVVQLGSNGSLDIFVVKYSGDGAVADAFTVGSMYADGSSVVTLDASGTLLLTGSFSGNCDFDPDAADHFLNVRVPNSDHELFVCKLDPGNHVSGKVFLDENSNGIYDAGEPGIPGVMLSGTASPGTSRYAISNYLGGYAMATDTGTWQVQLVQLPLCHVPIPTAQTLSFGNQRGTAVNNRDFAVGTVCTVNDLEVYISHSGIPRPGRDFETVITYKNVGTTTLSGTLVYRFDRWLTLAGVDPPPASANGHTISWNFTGFKPYASAKVAVILAVANNAAINTAFFDTAIVLPVVHDTTPWNNIALDSIKVRASVDPNDKSVFPDGDLQLPFVTADSNYLDYTIRFQNTGNDTAFNVVVTDTLSPLLAAGSLEMIEASHPFIIQLDQPNVLKWTFPGIMLPDSNVNKRFSHGFVHFRIRPRADLVAGQEIKNKAAIVFDYNDAVITNQVINRITGVMPVTLSSFSLKTISCKRVDLAWTTSSEEGNDHFVIERSVDGRSWKAVAIIKGAGNSAALRRYTYSDESSFTGSMQYRLEQVNKDGTSGYSFVQVARCGGDENFVRIYPNPVKDVVHISAAGSFSCDVYNEAGEMIRTKVSEASSMDISLGRFPAGVYVLRITGKNGSSIHKVVKK